MFYRLCQDVKILSISVLNPSRSPFLLGIDPRRRPERRTAESCSVLGSRQGVASTTWLSLPFQAFATAGRSRLGKACWDLLSADRLSGAPCRWDEGSKGDRMGRSSEDLREKRIRGSDHGPPIWTLDHGSDCEWWINSHPTHSTQPAWTCVHVPRPENPMTWNH